MAQPLLQGQWLCQLLQCSQHEACFCAQILQRALPRAKCCACWLDNDMAKNMCIDQDPVGPTVCLSYLEMLTMLPRRLTAWLRSAYSTSDAFTL